MTALFQPPPEVVVVLVVVDPGAGRDNFVLEEVVRLVLEGRELEGALAVLPGGLVLKEFLDEGATTFLVGPNPISSP